MQYKNRYPKPQQNTAINGSNYNPLKTSSCATTHTVKKIQPIKDDDERPPLPPSEPTYKQRTATTTRKTHQINKEKQTPKTPYGHLPVTTMEPRAGVEPAANSLQGCRSTTELPRRNNMKDPKPHIFFPAPTNHTPPRELKKRTD